MVILFHFFFFSILFQFHLKTLRYKIDDTDVWTLFSFKFRLALFARILQMFAVPNLTVIANRCLTHLQKLYAVFHMNARSMFFFY